MKKVRFLIFCLVSFSILTVANAANVATHWQTEQQAEDSFNILVDFYSKEITEQAYKKRLKACSESGNLTCSSMLGNHLYDIKEYREAYSLLMKSQGIIKFNSDSTHGVTPSEKALGDMFRFGHGVMQNYDKAIEHYKTCASIGDADCAARVSWAYIDKHANGSVTHSKVNATQAYAWLKIAQSLGEESYMNRAGKTLQTGDSIMGIKRYIRYSFGDTAVSDADELASQICSTIPGCIQ